jgi:hypothetical protein
MGWSVSSRETQLQSVTGRDVQVVIGPKDALGSGEVHRLLENVRRGGGLIFTVDDARELADSLGMFLRSSRGYMMSDRADECPARDNIERRTVMLPPPIHEIGWRRPPPGRVVTVSTGYTRRTAAAPTVIGLQLGAGRIAAVGVSDMLTNEAMRTCEWGADVAVARAIEFVRPAAGPASLVFDEYHHGEGVHEGSMIAITRFLSRTSSGRFLAQALLAGLILLFAFAPRPIVPLDAERIVRRSPLEHADALAHAYRDVGATKTATARLVSGVRRRIGRVVGVDARADDATFLDRVVARSPSLANDAAMVKRALRDGMPPRDFPTVGAAIASIERDLSTSPPARK